MGNRNLVSILCCGHLNIESQTSLVSLHLESIVMAEVPVRNGQHRSVVWISDLHPVFSVLHFLHQCAGTLLL